MSLTRLGQLGRKIEATSGTEETLAAADFRVSNRETAVSVQINRFDRNLKRGALTPDPTLAGSRSGQATFTEEFGPGGTATAEAPSAQTLKAMGMRRHAVQKLTIDSALPAGAKPGDRVGNNATFANATKTGSIVHIDTVSVWISSETGSAWAATDTVHGSVLGTAYSRTVSAQAAGGHLYRPFSETYDDVAGNVTTVLPPSMTIEERNNGERRTIIGCRGTGQIRLTRNEPPALNATFTGCPVFDNATGTWRTGAKIDGVSRLPVPPVFLNSDLRMYTVNDAGNAFVQFSPVFTEATIDLGGTVTLRETAGASLGQSGFVEARITERRAMLNLNPEAPDNSQFSLPKLFLDGRTFAVVARCGAVTHPCGLIVLIAPAAQINTDLAYGDRGGIETMDANSMLTGEDDREFLIAQVF